MSRPLNDRQRSLLRRIAEGQTADFTNAEKSSSHALRNRYLVRIKGAGSTWTATLTPEGEYFVRQGRYLPK